MMNDDFSNLKTVCVIPAFNEEKSIAKVLKEVKPLVDEVVVVDDGSSDRTVEMARKEGVVVLRHFINRGQGAALQTGNSYALKNGADIVVHFDADGQFEAREIVDMISPLAKGEADAVLGSRFMGKPNNMPAFKKEVIMPVARLVNKVVLGIDLNDPQSGFRALSKRALEEIEINQDKMAHCSEILYKLHKGDLRIKEVPISVTYHDFGQNLFEGVKVFKDLLLAKLMD